MSRSAFVQRFTDLVGRPPMTVRRDLHMRQAAHELVSGTLTMDQIAGHAGYDSRSSFVRAFRKAAPTRLRIGEGFLEDRIACAARETARSERGDATGATAEEREAANQPVTSRNGEAAALSGVR